MRAYLIVHRGPTLPLRLNRRTVPSRCARRRDARGHPTCDRHAAAVASDSQAVDLRVEPYCLALTERAPAAPPLPRAEEFRERRQFADGTREWIHATEAAVRSPCISAPCRL